MALQTVIKIILLLFLGYAAFSDAFTKQISLVSAGLSFLAGLVLQIITSAFSFLDLALACAIGIVLAGVSRLSGEALGYGDSVLFITSGIFLGFTENIFLLLFSLLLCAVYSIFMMLIGKKKIKDSIAFAPFILGGYLCVLAIA